MGFWNDDNTARAIKLWEDGLSATTVAERIGADSKNAIIGKINRLRKAGYEFKREAAIQGTRERSRVSSAGGKARISKARAKPKAGPKRKPLYNLAAVNIARRAEKAAAKATKVQAPDPAPIYDATFAKPWTERMFGECAFPVAGEGADTLSCCIGTKGKTYCPAHAARMFRKPDETGKRFVNGIARIAA